ncbi:hypothetical protein H7I01_17115 [Mycobacterium palustre]|nr:hypothetical protein [Mycobacterium palustre]
MGKREESRAQIDRRRTAADQACGEADRARLRGEPPEFAARNAAHPTAFPLGSLSDPLISCQ